ncbi:Ig-like domain-containing protein [uncultured Ferrimonas sp.]|uniref:beta strand repeat-containing protein n=1 Tax=uncultured Ferrimonas sp. TaxID=432640 RepID=UPI00260F0447|nr:Ig-like domain-containing protein [uncultured Ferrimonas sp.]
MNSSSVLTVIFDADATNVIAQEVVQSIRYRNSSEDPSSLDRTITFTATDAQAASSSDSRVVEITSVNDAPTAIALTSSSIQQSLAVSGAAIATLSTSDVDSGSFTYQLVSRSSSDHGDCGLAKDADNAQFQITTATLRSQAALAAGVYAICIESHDGEYSVQQAHSITVNDDIAPVFDSTPAVTAITSSAATLSVDLDEQGQVYFVVVANGESAPSVAQVRSGTDASDGAAVDSGNGSTVGTTASLSLAGLQPGTGYTVYVVAEDDEGTPNIQASAQAINFTSESLDITAPTVVLSSASSTVNSAFSISIEFSEAVSGFTQTDLQLSNATVSSFSGSSTSYSATIAPTADGAVTVLVPAAVAEDAATNGNSASNSLAVSFDGSAPTVVLSTVSDTVNGAFNISIEFSESVSGFIQTDLQLTNATVSSFSGSSGSYSAEITPTADGAVTVLVPAAVAEDLASNGNSASNSLAVSFDGSAPTAVLSTVSDTVNGAFNISIEFSESVSGFTQTDLQLTNGTVSSFSGSGGSYSAEITPTADGAVTVLVPAAVAQDAATNGNSASNSLAVSFDGSAPTVVLAAANSTVNGAFSISIEFSESVSGFTQTDLQLTNATVSSFSGSGTSYSAEITPTADGAVTVLVPAAVAQDAATNSNTASNSLAVSFDGSAPTVVLSSASSTVNGAFSISIEFSEAVSGFTQTDLQLSNATVSSFSGSGTSYSAEITPTADGAVTVSVPAAVAQDAATNGNSASNSLAVSFDGSAPTVVLSGASSTVNGAFNISIEFSEPVSGFTQTDLQLTNATVSSFSGSGTSYSAEITPTADGAVTVLVPAAVAQDAATNGNSASNSLAVSFDGSAPTVVLAGANGTVNGAFSISIEFSEAVSGFTQTDLQLTNATVSSFSGSGGSYNAEITPTADGAVTVLVPAAVAEDLATNGNSASNSLAVSFDGSAPTVVLSTVSDTVNGAFSISIEFSESVSGFTQTDLQLTNATVSAFSGSGSSYSAEITPTADGAVTVLVPAAVVEDLASNGNTVSNSLTVSFDGSAPTVVLAAANSTVNGAFNISIEFSEAVSGFAQTDLQLSNATVSSFSGSGTSYSAEITPTANGAVTVSVPAAVAQDAATNGNSASNSLAVSFDGSAPTVVLAGANGTVNGAFNVSIEFSESVSGFTQTDLQLTNGTVSSFSGSGGSYSATIVPTADGTVTVLVPAAVAQDAATNGNSASNSLAVSFDGSAPTVVLSGTSSTVNGAFNISIEFSEPVSGFTQTDLQLTNATVSSFSGSGTSYSAEITPTADGAVTVLVPAAVAEDLATNGNSASNSLAVSFDGSAPTVVLSTVSDTVNGAFSISIEFSEAVSGFTQTDLQLTNGTVSSFSGSGTSYSAEITPTADGAVTVLVPAAVAEDAASNGNSASNPLELLFDDSAPVVQLLSSVEVTNKPFVVSVTFNEVVAGFGMDGVQLLNGEPSNWQVMEGGFQFTVTPQAEGEVSISVVAAAAQDLAGNPNAASAPMLVIYDRTAPEATYTHDWNEQGDQFVIDLTFSEAVSELEVTDFTLNNAVLTEISGGSSQFQLVGAVVSQGESINLSLLADAVTDLAGNSNAVADYEFSSNRVGRVRIDGLAVAEQTLTAVVTDPDGVAAESISYQWYRGSEPEQSVALEVTAASVTLQAEHIGLQLWVMASYRDQLGFTEQIRSSVGEPILTVAEHALRAIHHFADQQGPEPSVETYVNAGVSSIDPEQLQQILSIINYAVQQLGSGQLDSIIELEAVIAEIMLGQDADKDGLPNRLETAVDTDFDGTLDAEDRDSDNDGIADQLEFFLSLNINLDPMAAAAGKGGFVGSQESSRVAHEDQDQDGIWNLFDADVDGNGELEPERRDDNLDGVDDAYHNLDAIAQRYRDFDHDGDGIMNHLDLDSDNDGITDITESGQVDDDSNGLMDEGSELLWQQDEMVDSNGDGIPNTLQLRSDGSNYDIEQYGSSDILDANGDGRLDGTIDMDNDGLIDVVDGAVGAFGSLADIDGDGIANHSDDDADGDGIPDIEENPQLIYFTGFDADADGIDDGVDHQINGVLFGVDADGNGIRDDRELPDQDNDGIADHLDAYNGLSYQRRSSGALSPQLLLFSGVALLLLAWRKRNHKGV